MHEIRMQHPGKNALGTDLIHWLDSEIERAGLEPILLTGTADAFSAGLDLREVHAHREAGLESMLRAFDALVARLYLHPAPTVALVNGHAIAGGCILALACDWRVAVDSPKARIGVNELALGVCFPPITLNVLRQRLPHHAVERVVLGAQLFAPADALVVGLVDEVSPESAELARKRLTTLAAHPRAAYAHTKRLLRSATVTSADERRFSEVEVPIWASPAVKERIDALINRKT